MISKAQIKQINSLSLKKYRKKLGLFKVEGTKMLSELLQSQFTVEKIFAVKSWLQQAELHNNFYINKVEEITAEELNQISDLETPNQVVALVKIPADSIFEHRKSQKLFLALESIRDPGNMGTILRIADWYNIPQVVCSEDCVDVFNSKTVQASMGSIFRVQAVYTNLEQWIKQTNIQVFAAVLNAKYSVYEFKKPNVAALLIGNESQGVSNEILQHVTSTVSIPKFGGAESLNAALATGILLDNFKRLEIKSE